MNCSWTKLILLIPKPHFSNGFVSSKIYDKRNFDFDIVNKKKVREKSRECHNHRPQPFPDPKGKRKPTILNKHKPNKRTKSTKISSLFPKRGNRNTKRTEKHKNKMTHEKIYNKSPRRIKKKVGEKFRKWHNHKQQPFPDPKRKRKRQI